MTEASSNTFFHEMGIDDRILEGIARMKWREPTLVQKKAIPFMLAGKNVLAQARTGSGKTGAFLIPCLHRVLTTKATAATQCVRVVVLAPSKELCRQISRMANDLCVGCTRELRVLDLSPHVELDHQKPLLAELPDVVVGPPGRILSHVVEGNLSLDGVQCVVVDEADLMVAYHHKEALHDLWGRLPPIYQCFITSATLSHDMKRISSLLLLPGGGGGGGGGDAALMQNTVILRLKETPLPATSQLTQYVIKLEEFEKCVLLYALYRLNMMRGKTIIFLNSVNKSYRLRMFLGQFGIPSCVLNCELPGASRCDIIEQFNSGKYDTIIATDETCVEPRQGKSGCKRTADNRGDQVEADLESGTSRGLDFQFVSNIINFDFPPSVVSYIHRVGRTARASQHGTALSLVSMKEQEQFEEVDAELSRMMAGGHKKLRGKTGGDGGDGGSVFQKYIFDLEQLDGFRYRALDVWRACTANAVLQTRKREISQQLLHSKALAVFFHDNPTDRALLKHEKRAHGIRAQNHLRNVPEYNIPDRLRTQAHIMGEDDEENNNNKSNQKKKNVKRLGQGAQKTGAHSNTSTTNKFSARNKHSKRSMDTKTTKKTGMQQYRDKSSSKAKKIYALKKKDPLRSMAFSGFSKASSD